MPEEPRIKLTKWLTEGIPAQDEIQDSDRTRLMFAGQRDWYMAALSLDDEYFKKRVELDMKLMMAYKGRRSDDVVASLTHLDEQDTIEAGLQPIRDAMKAQSRGKRRTEG